jgi:hypothetical protein
MEFCLFTIWERVQSSHDTATDLKHQGKLSEAILFLQENDVPHKAAIMHQKLADLHVSYISVVCSTTRRIFHLMGFRS